MSATSNSWVTGTPNASGVPVTDPTTTTPSGRQFDQALPRSGTVNSSGDNTLITPTAGKTTRCYYFCLSAASGNTGSVICQLRAGAAAAWYKVELTAGALWARSLGAESFTAKGNVNDQIILNLSGAQTIHWSIESDEI